MDAVRSMALIQERISNSFSAMHSDVSDRSIRGYFRACESFGSQARKDFDEIYRACFVEPVARFAILFPECEGLIKSRNAKLLDYDAARSKVNKAAEKPSSCVEKLPRVQYVIGHRIVLIMHLYSWSRMRQLPEKRTSD